MQICLTHDPFAPGYHAVIERSILYSSESVRLEEVDEPANMGPVSVINGELIRR
jgi:hypothetical protein